MKRFLMLPLFMLCVVNLFAQELNDTTFNKIINYSHIAWVDKANRRYFGCGMNVDCHGLEVVFRSIYLDKEKQRLRISGFVSPVSQAKGDTIGSNIFKIFIARPSRRNLKNIRILADVENEIKSKVKTASISLTEFSFEIDFKFSKRDFLYFEGFSIYRLQEYRIGSLLKDSAKK